MKQKAFFVTFKGLSIKQIIQKFFESPTSSRNTINNINIHYRTNSVNINDKMFQ